MKWHWSLKLAHLKCRYVGGHIHDSTGMLMRLCAGCMFKHKTVCWADGVSEQRCCCFLSQSFCSLVVKNHFTQLQWGYANGMPPQGPVVQVPLQFPAVVYIRTATHHCQCGGKPVRDHALKSIKNDKKCGSTTCKRGIYDFIITHKVNSYYKDFMQSRVECKQEVNQFYHVTIYTSHKKSSLYLIQLQ